MSAIEGKLQLVVHVGLPIGLGDDKCWSWWRNNLES